MSAVPAAGTARRVGGRSDPARIPVAPRGRWPHHCRHEHSLPHRWSRRSGRRGRSGLRLRHRRRRPGGLSAAVNLARMRRSVLVIDDRDGRSLWSQVNRNYLGFPDGIPAAEIRLQGRRQRPATGPGSSWVESPRPIATGSCSGCSSKGTWPAAQDRRGRHGRQCGARRGAGPIARRSPGRRLGGGPRQDRHPGHRRPRPVPQVRGSRRVRRAQPLLVHRLRRIRVGRQVGPPSSATTKRRSRWPRPARVHTKITIAAGRAGGFSVPESRLADLAANGIAAYRWESPRIRTQNGQIEALIPGRSQEDKIPVREWSSTHARGPPQRDSHAAERGPQRGGADHFVDSEPHTQCAGLYAAGDATSVHDHQVSAARPRGQPGRRRLPTTSSTPGPESPCRGITLIAVAGRLGCHDGDHRVPVSRRGAAPGRRPTPGVIEPSGSDRRASSRARPRAAAAGQAGLSGQSEAARTRSTSKPALRRARRTLTGEWS